MRKRLANIWVVIILVAIVWTAWQGHENAQQIKSALRTLAANEKASNQTRVSTVEQRCDLTRLLIHRFTVARSVTPALPPVAPFRASEATCQAQLKSVKAINAATPSH